MTGGRVEESQIEEERINMIESERETVMKE